MYKLLPDGEKSKATKEYSLRRLSAGLLLTSLVVLILIVLTLPSFFFVKGKRDAATFVLSTVERADEEVDKEALDKWVTQTEQMLTSLTPDDSKNNPYENFLKTLASKTQGVAVTGLSWARTNTAFTLKVSGIARDRQTLLQFQSSLKDSDNWAQVEFPVDTIARDTNLNFEMTLTPKKE